MFLVSLEKDQGFWSFSDCKYVMVSSTWLLTCILVQFQFLVVSSVTVSVFLDVCAVACILICLRPASCIGILILVVELYMLTTWHMRCCWCINVLFSCLMLVSCLVVIFLKKKRLAWFLNHCIITIYKDYLFSSVTTITITWLFRLNLDGVF